MSKIDYRPLEAKLKKDLKKERITAKELEEMDFDVIDFDESRLDKKQLKEFKKMMKIRSPLAKDYVKIKTLIKYKKEKHIVKLIDEFNAKAEQVNKLAGFLGILNEFKVETISISILRERMFVDYDQFPPDGVNPKNLELLKEKEEEDRVQREALEKEISEFRDNKAATELLAKENEEKIEKNEDIILEGDESEKTIKIDDNSVIQLEKSDLNEEDNMDEVTEVTETTTNNDIQVSPVAEEPTPTPPSEGVEVVETLSTNVTHDDEITSDTLQIKEVDKETKEEIVTLMKEINDDTNKEVNSVKEEIDFDVIDETADSFNFENDDLKNMVDDVKNFMDERILQASNQNEFKDINSTYDLEVEKFTNDNSRIQENQTVNTNSVNDTSEWTEGLNTENIESSMSEIDSMISSVDEIIGNMKDKVHVDENELSEQNRQAEYEKEVRSQISNFSSMYSANNGVEAPKELEDKIIMLQREIELLKQQNNLKNNYESNKKFVYSPSNEVKKDSVSGMSEINKKLMELSSFISSYDVRSRKEIEEEQSIYESLINKYMYNGK